MMNRRKFTQALAGLGAVAWPQKALPQTTASLPFKLSIMASTLGARLKPDVMIPMIADAGYQGVELNGEYQDWSDDEMRQFNQLKLTRGITCDCIVDRPGPGGAGIIGAADPKAGEAFFKKVTEMLAIAKGLEAKGIIIRPGPRVLSVSHETQHDVCVDNMKRAGDMAAKENLVLLLENGDREENAMAYLT